MRDSTGQKRAKHGSKLKRTTRYFGLYLHGHAGVEMGAKSIASHLNARDITLRGRRWPRSRVYEILASTTYAGKCQFNRRDRKAKKIKAAVEWVTTKVDPIIELEVFARVAARRASRAPARQPARTVNSPTLLTGLLKCGLCGAGMTLSTGKGGRYRYYKCNRRIGEGSDRCSCRSVRMEKLDGIVVGSLAEKVCVPARIKTILAELQRTIRAGRGSEGEQLRALKRELEDTNTASNRLYDAVEKGILTPDANLQERDKKHQARRQAILIEMANLRHRESLPLDRLEPGHIDAFAEVLRTKLLADKGFAK